MAHPKDILRPIFIVGPKGSGTTRLKNLLCKHAQIAASPQTHFLPHASRWGLSKGFPNDFEAYWDDYISSLRTHEFGIDFADFRRHLVPADRPSFQAIFRGILCTIQENAGTLRVVESTPEHSAFLQTVFEWFPNAQVLFTQRDPRAVVAAHLKAPDIREKLTPRSFRHGLLTGSREQEVILAANDWVKNHDEVLSLWAKDPRFYTVIYENLIQDIDSEMRRILKFLGEEFEPTISAKPNEDSVAIPSTEGGQRKQPQTMAVQGTRRNDDTSEEWDNELKPSEIAMVEGCCGKTMSALGYTPSVSTAAQFAGRNTAALLAFSGAFEKRGRKVASVGRRHVRSRRRNLELTLEKIAAAGIAKGINPAWFGYRGVQRETVQEYFARHSGSESAGFYEIVHPEQVENNPLPMNLSSRDALPDVQGWWGYSFWDVPQRTSTETFVATVPNCLLTWYKHPEKGNDFYPAILNTDSRAFDMREVRFRPLHAATLRRSSQPVRLKKAIWFIERVYHNHSHWLTAHLPKLLLLRERGMLGQVLLPPERTPAIDGSLRMLGLEPEDFETFDPGRPLFVEELTILGTDRFRPELLQKIPEAFNVSAAGTSERKVFISRLRASRRRLINEDEIWALLEPQGFERVFMEDMTFDSQVRLMSETAILIAPHGAGLTNMVFCQRGTHIVEIADLGFPNPNFYAVASALGHHYWLVSAESVGEVHPLEKDLRVAPEAIRDVLQELPSLCASKALG